MCQMLAKYFINRPRVSVPVVPAVGEAATAMCPSPLPTWASPPADLGVLAELFGTLGAWSRPRTGAPHGAVGSVGIRYLGQEAQP